MAEKTKRLPAEERKKQIMDVALSLFAEKGFEETKTRSIAIAAGISEAAMFKLFKNKEDIIMQSLDYKFGYPEKSHKKTFLGVLELENNDPELVLKRIGLQAHEMIENNIDLIRVIIYSILKHPEKMRKYLKANAREDQRIFKKIAEKGIENGIIKNLGSNIIGPVFPILMISLAVGNYLMFGKTSNKNQRKKLVDTIVEIYLHGIMK